MTGSCRTRGGNLATNAFSLNVEQIALFCDCHIPIAEYNILVPRAATTLDSFNAVAEPKRRRVLETLAQREMPVNELVRLLSWPQPMMSKHLGVLRQVGLVSMRRDGRRRMYRVNAEKLKLIHDWTKTFERYWQHQIDRIKERAERKAKHAKPTD